jgi:hypothetical protein
MVNNSFVSIVTVIERAESDGRLSGYLKKLHGILAESFSDFEIVLVNNSHWRGIHEVISPLSPELKKNIFLLNLSSPVNKNHAIVAGLDRANGDYTVIFELDLAHRPELVLSLFEKSQTGVDIVYLRAKNRAATLSSRPFYKIFYWILKKYSDLKVDDRAFDSRIISRRALNSLLRLRENLRYMKAIYSIIGYRMESIEIAEELKSDEIGFNEKFRTSLVAITSFTTFLRTLLLWIFLGSIVFLAMVIFNAVKVKMSGVDIFGTYHEAVPGWTFLVILTSIFFATTCLMLYIMSIYLSNIYQEIKHRPMYIIESVQRFD